MKKFLLAMLGTALAGGMAYAQQEEPVDPTQDTTQEQTSEYGHEVGEWDEQDPMSETEDPTQSEMDDPTMSETQPEESTTHEQEQQSTTEDPLYGQETGMQHGISDMSAEELKGMTLVSETGEEIGQVDRVGQTRVVTVDVGGFLGVGEKTIAIPVTELEMSSDGNLHTTLSKEALESRSEFNEQGFTEEGNESTSY